MNLKTLLAIGAVAFAGSPCLAAAPEGMAALPARTILLNWDRSLSWYTGWWLTDGSCSLPETGGTQNMPWYDFGTPRTIKVMELGTPYSNFDRLRSCVLQISNDNESWTTVYTIPSDYAFTANSLYQFEIPAHEPARYARFYKTINPYNMPVSEFVLYSTDVTISTDRPVVWANARALESSLPAGQVDISGALSATATGAMHLYAYAAAEDCGDDRAAWQVAATETLDLGEVQPGASFAGSFTRLAKGKFHWRVFGVSGSATVVSQPTVAFVKETQVIYPKAYVKMTDGTAGVFYDGKLTDNSARASYVVFDLRSIPEAWNFASLRCFLNTGNNGFRGTLGNSIKFGYEAETTDWSGYITKEVRGETDQHPTWVISGLPDGITWKDEQDPFYTLLTASDDKVCELAFDLPNAARPDYLYVATYNVQVSELELRALTDEPPPHVHDFGAWETNKAVAAGVPGERRRTCADCGEFESEILPPLPNPTKDPQPLPAKTIVLHWDRTLSSSSSWFLNDGSLSLGELPDTQNLPWCDFGTPRTIKTMEIGTYSNDNNNERLRGFSLDVSADNENWETVFTIPNDYVFPVSSLVRFEIPDHLPVRYARLYRKTTPHNMYITEFVLYSDDVTITAGRPVLWSTARALKSPVPAEGVKFTGTLSSTATEAMRLYAYAADVDYGDDRSVWMAAAQETVDLGEIQSGASFTNCFSKLKAGKHHWRVFGVSGDVVVASQPTVAFVTGGKFFYPKAYVASEGSAAVYDGKTTLNGNGGTYAVFDLRSLPENYDFAAVRILPRNDSYTYRATLENEIKFGYESETIDWSGKVKKVVRGDDDQRPTSVISGIPDGITWQDVQDPLYTIFKMSDDKVCELAVDLPKKARPAYLYVKANRLSFDEIEFRMTRQPSGLVILLR